MIHNPVHKMDTKVQSRIQGGDFGAEALPFQFRFDLMIFMNKWRVYKYPHVVKFKIVAEFYNRI